MLLEIADYQPQIDVLVAFAEGRLDETQLAAALGTDEMRTLLGTFEDPRSPASTNHYRRLQAQLQRRDGARLGALVNCEGIVERFLEHAQVGFHPAKRYQTAFSLIQRALPDYLDPPLDFLTEKIIPQDDGLTEPQKKKIIQDRLKEYFRSVGKPPQWVQNPDWPIRDGRPLVFIGQVAVGPSDLFHDSGAVYVFFDPVVGDFETVAQFH